MPPLELNDFGHTGLKVSNTAFYINSTDGGHLHLKGLVTNTLHEKIGSITISLSVSDKSTGTLLGPDIYKSFTDFSPSVTIPFDIGTNYHANDTQYIKGLLTY